MARLIHLNGAPGVGKSTLARRWVDERPGTLDLDIDQVVPLLSGWRREFWAVLDPARRLALAMAGAHLASGHDVVLPQLVTDVEQARRFEGAAAAVGAAYVEVALLASESEQVARFRGKQRVTDVDRLVGAQLEELGGDSVLTRIHRHHTEYLAQRPDARRLETDGQDPEATYGHLVGLLEG